MVAVAETHVHMSSDAKRCRMKLLIESKSPSGIIYMFQIFVDEVVRDYFPEMGYKIMVEVENEEGCMCLADLSVARDAIKSGRSVYVQDMDGNQEIGQVEIFSDWMTSYETDAKYDIFLFYPVGIPIQSV